LEGPLTGALIFSRDRDRAIGTSTDAQAFQNHETLATLALTVAFLSAGAFAKHPAPAAKFVNVTVVTKNQEWPLKLHSGGFTGCDNARCIEI
jgi:hypothetical protein